MQTVPVILVLVCNYFIQNVSSVVMNLSPPNGSLIAQQIGAVNTSTFECDIFQEDSNGNLIQITTTWTLQHFRSSGDDIILIVQSEFEGVFLIGGTPRPPGSFSPTYRNKITILNFTEEFDGTVLFCGTGLGEERRGHFNLRVYRAPQLISGLVHEVLEGTTTSVDILSGPEAFPFPTDFQWRKDGMLISNSSTVLLGFPSVTFLNVSRADSGDYSLDAINYHLDNPSEEIGRGTGGFHLNVLYGPDILMGPSTAVGTRGGGAVLICGSELSSNPPATVLWMDNNQRRVDSGSSRIALNNGPLSVSLEVVGLTREDAGDWSCSVQVENAHTFQHSINLIVVDSPSEPQNIRLISSGPTWAYLSWSRPLSPGFPPSSSQLYVVMATRVEDGSTRHTPPVATLVANVTGLFPNSYYEFTVLAQSVVDHVVASSSPSEMAFVRTATTVPEIQCRTAPFSNNGTIEVSWFYVHTGGLNLTQVSVSYSLDSPVLRFQQPNDSQPLAGVDSTSFVAYELQAGNNYIFKIVSSNSVGHSSATCPPVTHDIGIPQTPVLYGTASSDGVLTIDVATNASGTEPGSFFQFNVMAQHTITLEIQTFTIESREYVSGERILLSLGGLTSSESGDGYLITVSCTNMFGTSQNSNQLSVVIEFSTGELAAPLAGAIGAVVVIIIVLCLMAVICTFQYRKKHELEKRKYSPAEHTNNSTGNSPYDSEWTKGLHYPAGFKQNLTTGSETPQYESIPDRQKDSKQSGLYDSLKPGSQAPPSLPSPSTLRAHKLPDSTEDITRRKGSTNVLRHSRSSSCLNIPPLEIRRKSSSVPDFQDQSVSSLDFPAGILKPISITRDILELEEGYNTKGKGTSLRVARWHNNEHLIGYDRNLANFQISVSTCTEL